MERLNAAKERLNKESARLEHINNVRRIRNVVSAFLWVTTFFLAIMSLHNPLFAVAGLFFLGAAIHAATAQEFKARDLEEANRRYIEAEEALKKEYRRVKGGEPI